MKRPPISRHILIGPLSTSLQRNPYNLPGLTKGAYVTMPDRPLPAVIRTARLGRQLTQRELAARVGVNQSTISFWESGAETPTVEHLILLALELPAILEALAGREGELLTRVLRLERDVFPGRCACAGCTCQPRESVSELG